MEFDVIIHNIKKLIVENDIIILEKFFQYFNDDEIFIEDLYDEEINGLSFIQYAAKHNLDKVLKVLLKNNFDPNLTSSSNQIPPLMLAIQNKSDKAFKELLNCKRVELIFKYDQFESNIFIELAKVDSINEIKYLIKKEHGINLLKHTDNIGNNVIFYLTNQSLVKQIVNLEPKILNSVNMYNDNYILYCCKNNNKEMTQWIINNYKVKINQLNNEDRNIIHYFLINKWFNLLDKLDIKSNKKELLIFDIHGNDLFSLLMLSGNLKIVEKYFRFFINDDCLKHYIGLVAKWNVDIINFFFNQVKRKLTDELMFNMIVSLLEANKTGLCKVLISQYHFKNKSFYELILYTVDKYNEKFSE